MLYECHGRDGHKLLHCWILERCAPLNEFAKSKVADKEKCVLAACLCITKASLHGLLLSDCHFYKFGVRITQCATEHKVVIIDAGSRGLVKRIPPKRKVNECMRNF